MTTTGHTHHSFGIAALKSFAYDIAYGGAPLTWLAMYKVCCHILGRDLALKNPSFGSHMLATINDTLENSDYFINICMGMSIIIQSS